MITEIGPKDPSEVKSVSFDFTNQVGVATLASATVVVTVISGSDMSPSAVLSGSAAISGLVVNQRLKDGVAGNRYMISCLATDSVGLVHKVVAAMRVAKPTV